MFIHTVNGQEKTILNNILKDCPDNIEKSNKLEDNSMSIQIYSILAFPIIFAGILLIEYSFTS